MCILLSSRLLSHYLFIFIYFIFYHKDCMYLHDVGDMNASFTKEDMQAGYVYNEIIFYYKNTFVCIYHID